MVLRFRYGEVVGVDALDKIAERDYELVAVIEDGQVHRVKYQDNTGDLVSVKCGDRNTEIIKELYAYQDRPEYLADVIICIKRVTGT